MATRANSGMETFDHLTDKTKRFLLRMDEEDIRLDDLKARVEMERQVRDKLIKKRDELRSAISQLEARRNTFDGKVSTLIDALGDIPLNK